MPETPITTVESLREHLQTALEIEHSTIPPYLCALYSIPNGSNVSASTLIRSVVMEEMLHMVLVANLLNAMARASRRPTRPRYPACAAAQRKKFVVHSCR